MKEKLIAALMGHGYRLFTRPFELNIIDNGPGIDYRFHDKIFVIFQTLNARDAVEATGAGLAIAKKIANAHGFILSLKNIQQAPQ
mgnify:CR=1 FL=1